MAGRVLRDSNGRYAGSTRGWGAGRTTHGGGFGSGVKGKTRSVGAQRAIQRGKSIGVQVGKGIAVNAALAGTFYAVNRVSLGKVNPNKVAYGALAVGVAYQATRKIVRSNLRR